MLLTIVAEYGWTPTTALYICGLDHNRFTTPATSWMSVYCIDPFSTPSSSSSAAKPLFADKLQCWRWREIGERIACVVPSPYVGCHRGIDQRSMTNMAIYRDDDGNREGKDESPLMPGGAAVHYHPRYHRVAVVMHWKCVSWWYILTNGKT